MNRILKYWLSSKLPKQYLKPRHEDKDVLKNIRNFLVHWLAHPVKRRIARYYCLILQKFFGLTVIAITGSTGKTSTKEMTASILGLKGKTVASRANIDPIYNIPTTILRCLPSTKYLVLEMGVEFPEEMDFYLWLVKPQMAVITGIHITHTEFFKDVKGVFKEKSKLAKAISRQGYVILSGECNYLKKLNKLKTNIIYYGKNSKIKTEKIMMQGIKSTKFTLVVGEGKIDVQLPAIGEQNVQNSLAAASAAYFCGVNLKQIKKGLESFKPPVHRLIPLRIKQSIILDDSYNNNPHAAEKTIETFNNLAKKRIKVVVFGDMAELGELGAKAHRDIGKILGASHLDLLVGVGDLAKLTVEEASRVLGKDKCIWVKDQRKVDSHIKPFLDKKSIILLKGAHYSICLDKVVARLSK